jgi:Uma2 family endonuclease
MSIATDPNTDQLIEELHKVDGKAEIVEGKIIMMSPTGDMPSSAGFAIAISLREHSQRIGGRAYTDNAAFIVDLPNRKSFSPDAAYYTGPRTKMKFLQGAPDFAAEVRSEGDYGPGAEREIAAKRVDYFTAGTKVVWDVDLLSDDVVRVYRAGSPQRPMIYRRGERAEAEPAVPGWMFAVDELFD